MYANINLLCVFEPESKHPSMVRVIYDRSSQTTKKQTLGNKN